MLYLVMIAVVLWFFRMDRFVKKQRHHLRQPGLQEEEDKYENQKNLFEPGGKLHHLLDKKQERERDSDS